MSEAIAPRRSVARYALFTVPLVLLAGLASGRIAGSGYGNPWFDALVKPEAMPPGWVFGVAWSILYILLGLVLALLLHAPAGRERTRALALFALQLALNFAWSTIFFARHDVPLALTLVAAMVALAVASVFLFGAIRRAAGALMLPYVAWLGFATWLTLQIAVLNSAALTLVR